MSSSHPKAAAPAQKKAAEKPVAGKSGAFKSGSPKSSVGKSSASKSSAAKSGSPKSVAPKKAAKSAAPAGASGNFLLYPPQSPVDVPNFPHPDPALDETAKQSQPVENDKPESNWADDGKPAPYAKNARSSLL